MHCPLGILPVTAYPFGPGRYVIPAGANTKKALSKTDIDRIKTYQPMPGTMERRSLDLWLFSYYCNGANFTDICHLAWGNVDLKGNKLTFVRMKTARSTKQKQTSITAYLRPETAQGIFTNFKNYWPHSACRVMHGKNP